MLIISTSCVINCDILYILQFALKYVLLFYSSKIDFLIIRAIPFPQILDILKVLRPTVLSFMETWILRFGNRDNSSPVCVI